MNPVVGWSLAAGAAVAAVASWGVAGLGLVASGLVFFVLVQATRSLRVMRAAASSPVGHVAGAVMLHAGLAPGMTMLAVIARTKSLGQRAAAGDDAWRWHDDGGAAVVMHFERGRLARWRLERAPGDAGETASVESTPV